MILTAHRTTATWCSATAHKRFHDRRDTALVLYKSLNAGHTAFIRHPTARGRCKKRSSDILRSIIHCLLCSAFSSTGDRTAQESFTSLFQALYRQGLPCPIRITSRNWGWISLFPPLDTSHGPQRTQPRSTGHRKVFPLPYTEET